MLSVLAIVISLALLIYLGYKGASCIIKSVDVEN